ncbi:MAG: YegS/Rv2252/BmrU family lipid kinase [Eubacteriales bacterium]|nr:YegS/Rv2252/BmrU family lipid kinase [Eubacteriales bacterium]
MKKMLFIMNPVSGQKKANRVLSEIIQEFNRAGYEVVVYMTNGPGAATELAQYHGEDADLIVCCGGDGTLNETITGLMRAGLDIPVGYIPSGSTNDFAASLKISGNPVQAARDIVEGEPRQYDVGKFADRYFSYVASFGAFTRTSYTTPQSVKNALGHTAYVLSGISELSQIRNEHIRMEIDGEVVEDDYLFGAICNSTSVGGVVNLNPRMVDMSDGLFEILMIRAPKNLMEIHECIQAVQNQTYDCAMITFRTGSHIKITADPEMPWTLDGEREDGHAVVEVHNLHRAIRLVQKEQSQ